VVAFERFTPRKSGENEWALADGAPVRVLIVDDDDLFLESVKSLLEAHEGIEVVATAGSGEEAVDAAMTHEPECICMDVAMPGIGGIEASRAIRAELPSTRVILVSGSIFSDFAGATEQADAEAFTTKARLAVDLPAAVLRICRGQAV
jgi:DNA-binding NarL/FixJ family response regulator